MESMLCCVSLTVCIYVCTCSYFQITVYEEILQNNMIASNSVAYFVPLKHESESVSHSVASHSLWPHRQQPERLLYPWDFPGKNTGVSWYSLLQGIFQGSNPRSLHCRQIIYRLSYQGNLMAWGLEFYSQ